MWYQCKLSSFYLTCVAGGVLLLSESRESLGFIQPDDMLDAQVKERLERVESEENIEGEGKWWRKGRIGSRKKFVLFSSVLVLLALLLFLFFFLLCLFSSLSSCSCFSCCCCCCCCCSFSLLVFLVFVYLLVLLGVFFKILFLVLNSEWTFRIRSELFEFAVEF